MQLNDKKVVIVEGTNDKHHIKKVLLEDVDIICTYGTFGVEKFDEMLEAYNLDYRDVYIFVDSDEPGEKLRQQLKQELPHAHHLYVPPEWAEVEATPEKLIAHELLQAHFEVHSIYFYL
ncbi:MAG TPA: toprim domain-containing protein [Pseudogracilibacillus sp.]|nr:toprim domain-containing protein [Pseudogracilibacillus sp.]